MSRMMGTWLQALAVLVGMSTVAVAQTRTPGTRPEPGIEYRTRESMSVEAGWPGPVRQAPGSIQLAKHSQSRLPPSPPAENEADPLLPTGPVFEVTGPVRTIREYSRIYIDPLPPKKIQLHDIVTIIVDEKSEVIMNQKFNRQKNAGLKADLKSFV